MGLSWDSPIDWQGFDAYVFKSFALNTLRDYRRYARHFSDVLTTGDASPLLSLSDAKRRHVLASLAALSNFLGAKERWKHIVSEYGLKWTSKNDLGDLVGLLYSNRLDDMISELRTVLETVPEDYGNYYRFNVLTGLRPNEAVRAVNMLRTSRQSYLNPEMGVLEHFRYPQNFIRNTKKAFISVVDDEALEIARNTRSLEYQAIRSQFRRQKLPFIMRYCRKIFATYMKKRFDVELVDLLQGRVPTGVFAKYYNRPNYREEIEKVRAALPELGKLIS